MNITATDARKEWFHLLKETIENHLEVFITTKSGEAVMMSKADYEALIETLSLLSLPKFRESLKESNKDIKNGKVYTLDEVF